MPTYRHCRRMRRSYVILSHKGGPLLAYNTTVFALQRSSNEERTLLVFPHVSQ